MKWYVWFFCSLMCSLILSGHALAGELTTLGAQGPATAPNDPLNTGPFNCSGYGNSGQVTVTYTMPVSLQLKGVLFFPGAWARVVADIGWRLVNVTSGQVIYWTNWDHYVSMVPGGVTGPLTPQQVWFPLPANDWILLHQGDHLQLQVYCTDYSGFGFAVQAHVAATLYGVSVTP